MIHFELCYKKYHRSIIKNVIKASQKRHEAFLKAKLPTLQEVPKKSPDVWALCAHRTGNRCPTLGLLMPNAWSLSAHLMGKTDHLSYLIIWLLVIYYDPFRSSIMLALRLKSFFDEG